MRYLTTILVCTLVVSVMSMSFGADLPDPWAESDEPWSRFSGCSFHLRPMSRWLW